MRGRWEKLPQCKSFLTQIGSGNDIPTTTTAGQNTIVTANGDSPEADVARGVVS